VLQQNGIGVIPGLVKVFSLDKITGLPSEVVGADFILPAGATIVRADPIAHFLYVAGQSAIFVLQYDPDTGQVKSNSTTDLVNNAVIDFSFSTTGDELANIEENNDPFPILSLQHFAIDPQSGILTPTSSATLPAPNPHAPPIINPISSLLSSSTANLFILSSLVSLSDATEYHLLSYQFNSTDQTYVAPNDLMLSVYGNDQETGTRIGAVFLSPDGRDLFFMSRTDNSSFANGILSFTHSGGLGSLNVDTTTGVPTLTTTADFGVPCTSGWISQKATYVYVVTQPIIVGAAIG